MSANHPGYAFPVPSPAASLQAALVDAAVEALDPAELGREAERAVADLLAQGSSANTDRSYRAALRYWAAWYFARYRRPIALPVSPAVVTQFIVDHAAREVEGQGLVIELPSSLDQILVAAGFKGQPGPMALATLEHRISVLSKQHQARGLDNPCRHTGVRELLSRTRRAYAGRGARGRRAPALVRAPLELMLDTCDESLRGTRDRALLLFAWASGGRRRSEVAAARLEFLRRVGDAFIYTLDRSKTNQEGADRPENDKPIQGPAATALDEWLRQSGIVEGALFRRIRKGDRLAQGLSDSAVRDIVKLRAALAGLDVDFSAHSLRSGFVTEASSQGASLGDIMAMTGHASVTTVLRYHRRAAVQANPAAQLLEPRPAESKRSENGRDHVSAGDRTEVDR